MVWSFLINSILLGFGLAMDAFSVSIANGLHDPQMKNKRMCLIAGTFAFFQFIMPMAGWICVHFLAEAFTAFQPFIPWIALLLLSYIGGKMILEGIHGNADGDSCEIDQPLTYRLLAVQGVATSIDALSTGFAIADYHWAMALAASAIIAVVTFAVCVVGVKIGKRFGMKLAKRASILGGVILILIGIEILVSHL